jgi:hypothetical protein
MRVRALVLAAAVGAMFAVVGAQEAVRAQENVTFATLPARDYFEIKQLYARYVQGLDSGANGGNAFANVFTPSGVLMDEHGTLTQGHAELAALARATGKGSTHVAHFETNLLIVPAPGGATGRSYVVSVGPGPGGQPILTNDGQFQDELVKTPAGWRFSKREYHAAPLERAATGAPSAR